jgi:hypothetical protein
MGRNPDWQEGYDTGYASGYEACLRIVQASEQRQREPMPIAPYGTYSYMGQKGSKPKRKQSKKQKILNEMAGVKWRKYKKGSGKKTYFDIRAEVTRSAIYKKKVKNL